PFGQEVASRRPPGPDVAFPADVRDSVSVITRFRNPQRRVMASTHHYDTPRGRLGSGYEDPFTMVLDGEVVDRALKDHEHCPECDQWRPQAEQSRALLPAPRMHPTAHHP